MTAKDRRALETELKPKAAAKNLRLEHRERTAGAWVWDAVDTQTSMVVVRGVSLAEMATYIRGPEAA